MGVPARSRSGLVGERVPHSLCWVSHGQERLLCAWCQEHRVKTFQSYKTAGPVSHPIAMDPELCQPPGQGNGFLPCWGWG